MSSCRKPPHAATLVTRRIASMLMALPSILRRGSCLVHHPAVVEKQAGLRVGQTAAPATATLSSGTARPRSWSRPLQGSAAHPVTETGESAATAALHQTFSCRRHRHRRRHCRRRCRCRCRRLRGGNGCCPRGRSSPQRWRTRVGTPPGPRSARPCRRPGIADRSCCCSSSSAAAAAACGGCCCSSLPRRPCRHRPPRVFAGVDELLPGVAGVVCGPPENGAGC